jgi:hypothetical protein
MGLGVKRRDKQNLLKLFNWKETVKVQLSQLSLGPHQAGTKSIALCAIVYKDLPALLLLLSGTSLLTAAPDMGH